jgi:sarcosine oxidase
MTDAVIVGAGVMGAAAACELAARGVRVALIDQARLPNPRAASMDHSKVFRFAYPDPLYARMAVDALAGWRALEHETGARLMTATGLLLIGRNPDSSEAASYAALRSLGLEADLLDSSDAAKRFPQLNPDAFAFAVYDPSGAILHAETAVRALIALARRRGVVVTEEQRIVSIKQDAEKRVVTVTERGDEFYSERAIIASGPWTRKLLPELDSSLTTTRQEVAYFEPTGGAKSDFEVGAFPIFIEIESGFYGFPIHHAGAMKIANHHKGETVDPYSYSDRVTDGFIRECREFFSDFIPALAGATLKETRVCLYNNTPDDDFIIDWHAEVENALIVTGFSGHGFKFGPAVGRISAELLLTGRASFDVERFSLARLGRQVR